MTESLKVAGRDLTPITTGYEPHAFVVAVGKLSHDLLTHACSHHGEPTIIPGRDST